MWFFYNGNKMDLLTYDAQSRSKYKANYRKNSWNRSDMKKKGHYENILYWSLSRQAMSYNFTVLYHAALHSLTSIIQLNTSVAPKLLALCSVWRRPMLCQPQQEFPVIFRCWLEDQHWVVSHPANVDNILVWGLGARDNVLFTKLIISI